MTIRIPKWLAGALAVALIAGAIAVAFLLGRSTEDDGTTPAAFTPDGGTTATTTEEEVVQPAKCSKAEAERATIQSEFDDAISDTLAAQAKLAGFDPLPPQFFTKYATDYQVAILECRDLTNDDVEEMVVGIASGASGKIFQWAIFTPDTEGQWQLAFHREGSNAESIKVRGDAVVVSTPTYGQDEPLCCPSGHKSTEVAFEDGGFQVVSPPVSPSERVIEFSDAGLIRIGHFQPQTDSSVQAFTEFGTPTSISGYSDTSCPHEWSDLGLKITFANLGGGDPCGPEGSVGSIDLVGTPAEQAGWHTSEGARIGMSAGDVRDLYPGATQHGSQLVLLETPSPYGGGGTTPLLAAYTAGGRVLAFRMDVGAAGE